MVRRAGRLAGVLGRAVGDAARLLLWVVLVVVGLSVVSVLGFIGGVAWATHHVLERLHL